MVKEPIECGMYDIEKAIYFLLVLFIIGNTCLFIGLIMVAEDKKSEKKRKVNRQKKGKKKNHVKK